MKKRIAISVFLLLLILSIFPGNAFAACSHPTLGPTYSEATHPHAYYRTCSSCGVKVYTGGYATKQHGNGTWGSGTCPSCGTHSYSGRSCTSVGRCVCGATQPALGHSYGTKVYYEIAHPHREFTQCARCSAKSYTGNYTTLTHGTSTTTTCPSCGSHSYGFDAQQMIAHPHPMVYVCKCGDSKVTDYTYGANCATCRAQSKPVSIYEEVPITMLRFEGDAGAGFPFALAIKVGFSYSEDYLRDSNVFASLGSASQTKILLVDPAYKYQVQATSNSRVPYYNSAGTEIFSATLYPVNYPLSMDYTSVVGSVFHNSPLPAYSKPGVTAMLDNGFWPGMYDARVNYTY